MKSSLFILMFVVASSYALIAQPPKVKKRESKVVNDTLYLYTDTIKMAYTVRIDGDDGVFYGGTIYGYMIASQYKGSKVFEMPTARYVNQKFEAIKQKIIGSSEANWQE